MKSSSNAVERVRQVIADPPGVHNLARGPDAPVGVWAADQELYEFLALRVGPSERTLETGSGLSTLVFAICGARHTAITPAAEEEERLRRYADNRDLDLERVNFVVAYSEDVLRTWDESLDVILIDGGHGFPTPILDWYLAGSKLRRGGVLVLDDINLPAVHILDGFLRGSHDWGQMARTEKWSAWRRTTDRPLSSEWTEQPWMRRVVGARVTFLGRRVVRRLRRFRRSG